MTVAELIEKQYEQCDHSHVEETTQIGSIHRSFRCAICLKLIRTEPIRFPRVDRGNDSL